MPDFTFHTVDTAPEAARATLAAAQARLGFVPNLYAGMANAPAALSGYLAVAEWFDRTSLDPVERQVVLLTASVINGCEFCVAAHSMIGKKMAGMSVEVADAIRANRRPGDVRIGALWEFTKAVVEQRGWVADHASLRVFLGAGYTQAQALEVVLGVTQKTLSNYANHLLKTPLNAAFESERWHAGDAK